MKQPYEITNIPLMLKVIQSLEEGAHTLRRLAQGFEKATPWVRSVKSEGKGKYVIDVIIENKNPELTQKKIANCAKELESIIRKGIEDQVFGLEEKQREWSSQVIDYLRAIMQADGGRLAESLEHGMNILDAIKEEIEDEE